jgi:membrane protein YqaA with SNARE-associated domain
VKQHALAIAAFVWGVAEATLFFVVPDVLLSCIGLKHGARRGMASALSAALGATLGGVILYIWSTNDAEAALAAVSAVPAVSDAMIANAHGSMIHNWIAATFLGPLTATPYKVFAILAPHQGVPLAAFAIASVLARLPRFLIAATGAALAGRFLGRWLSQRQLTWVLIGAWLLFYAVFFALMPN